MQRVQRNMACTSGRRDWGSIPVPPRRIPTLRPPRIAARRYTGGVLVDYMVVPPVRMFVVTFGACRSGSLRGRWCCLLYSLLIVSRSSLLYHFYCVCRLRPIASYFYELFQFIFTIYSPFFLSVEWVALGGMLWASCSFPSGSRAYVIVCLFD